MNCRWCSNPEGILPYPVPLYNSDKCIYDGLCVKACNQLSAISHQPSAISIEKSTVHSPQSTGNIQSTIYSQQSTESFQSKVQSLKSKENVQSTDKLEIERNLCASCIDNKCAEVCNTGAMKIAGYYTTVDELYAKLQRDRDYWGEKGGITLTGGEPFKQPEFATSILKKCFESYMHTAIETCGNVSWKYYEDALKYIEWIFYDIKHINSIKHKEWTGVDNKLILENAKKLSEHFKGRIIIRVPLVPGFNDSEFDVEDIADFMLQAGLKEVNILPVHHLGREKYKLMYLQYFDNNAIIPDQNKINQIKDIFETKGIACYEGYKTPF